MSQLQKPLQGMIRNYIWHFSHFILFLKIEYGRHSFKLVYLHPSRFSVTKHSFVLFFHFLVILPTISFFFSFTLPATNLSVRNFDFVLENDPGDRFIAGRGGKGAFVSVITYFLFAVFIVIFFAVSDVIIICFVFIIIFIFVDLFVIVGHKVIQFNAVRSGYIGAGTLK